MKTRTGISVFLACLSLTSCASLTNRNNRLLLTGVGVFSGTAVGLSRPEEKTKNAVLYGSLIGVGTALISEFIFDDEKEKARLRKETEVFKTENDVLKRRDQPVLNKEGSSLLEADLPKDLRAFIQPGSWKRFRLDRWVQDQDNDNVWFRQTEMFEVTPPNLGN